MALASHWLVSRWAMSRWTAGRSPRALQVCVTFVPFNTRSYFCGTSEAKVLMYSGPGERRSQRARVALVRARLGPGEVGVIWGTVVSLCFFGVIRPLGTASVIRSSVGA